MSVTTSSHPISSIRHSVTSTTVASISSTHRARGAALHKEILVTPDEFLRAAALNDLYTIRKFFDFEIRYAWGTDTKSLMTNTGQVKTKNKKDQKKGAITNMEAHQSVYTEHDLPADAAKHKSDAKMWRTTNGENALQLACAYGNYRAMTLIHQHSQINLDAVDADGFNCVHHAVLGGNMNCLRWNIKKGGDWNLHASPTKRGRGETPFMLAVRCHRKNMVDYFLKKHRIDFHDTNANGKTVHGIALETKRPGMVWLMRKKTDEPKSELEKHHIAKLKAKRALHPEVDTSSISDLKIVASLPSSSDALPALPSDSSKSSSILMTSSS